MTTITRWVLAHRRWVAAFWIVVTIVGIATVGQTTKSFSSEFSVPGRQGFETNSQIQRLFGQGGRTSPLIPVVTLPAGTSVSSPVVRAGLLDVQRRLQRAIPGLRTASFASTGNRAFVSADGRTTFVLAYPPPDNESFGNNTRAAKTAQAALSGQTIAGAPVRVTGIYALQNQTGGSSGPGVFLESVLGGLGALVVLAFVFASLLAFVPLLMAIVSIVVTMGLVSLLSQAFDLSIFIVNMLVGMGLALGIDYSLFVISRYREERTGGHLKDAAIRRAGATASRAVLFSGTTFVAALFGMLLVPTNIMRSLAAGAIIVGVVSVAAALTLMPALLSVLGDRINALRVPVAGRNVGEPGGTESRFWRWIVNNVVHRPGLSFVLSAGLLIACAIPLLGLHVGASGVDSLPGSLPSKRGQIALQRAFPATSPYPVEIVVQGGAGAARRLASLEQKLAGDPRFGRGTIRRSPSADVLLLTAPVRGDPVGGASISAVRNLHDSVIPSAFAGTGAKVLVGGKTEENSEYFDAATNPAPYVLVFVLGLSFVVLTVAFRSLVVALVSILLNLLSVGAAYGLITLVFLHGYGASFFGFQHVPVVDAWVPLFLFSVLFGLSMDYQVFLVSRIKERYDEIGDTKEAVASGVASTARIITGAALIIVVVFTGFARGQLVQFQQMGFGVAVALLLDATIIRSVVLPSALTLLGDRTWYLPRWLDWLPHLEVESGPREELDRPTPA